MTGVAGDGSLVGPSPLTLESDANFGYIVSELNEITGHPLASVGGCLSSGCYDKVHRLGGF